MTLSSRFEEALVLATRLHAGQYRKGSGVPYICHPLAVASLVLGIAGCALAQIPDNTVNCAANQILGTHFRCSF